MPPPHKPGWHPPFLRRRDVVNLGGVSKFDSANVPQGVVVLYGFAI